MKYCEIFCVANENLHHKHSNTAIIKSFIVLLHFSDDLSGLRRRRHGVFLSMDLVYGGPMTHPPGGPPHVSETAHAYSISTLSEKKSELRAKKKEKENKGEKSGGHGGGGGERGGGAQRGEAAQRGDAGAERDGVRGGGGGGRRPPRRQRLRQPRRHLPPPLPPLRLPPPRPRLPQGPPTPIPEIPPFLSLSLSKP